VDERARSRPAIQAAGSQAVQASSYRAVAIEERGNEEIILYFAVLIGSSQRETKQARRDGGGASDFLLATGGGAGSFTRIMAPSNNNGIRRSPSPAAKKKKRRGGGEQQRKSAPPAAAAAAAESGAAGADASGAFEFPSFPESIDPTLAVGRGRGGGGSSTDGRKKQAAQGGGGAEPTDIPWSIDRWLEAMAVDLTKHQSDLWLSKWGASEAANHLLPELRRLGVVVRKHLKFHPASRQKTKTAKKTPSVTLLGLGEMISRDAKNETPKDKDLTGIQRARPEAAFPHWQPQNREQPGPGYATRRGTPAPSKAMQMATESFLRNGQDVPADQQVLKARSEELLDAIRCWPIKPVQTIGKNLQNPWFTPSGDLRGVSHPGKNAGGVRGSGGLVLLSVSQLIDLVERGVLEEDASDVRPVTVLQREITVDTRSGKRDAGF